MQLLREPEGFRHLLKMYQTEYTTPFGVEQVFEATNSINILSLRDNWTVSLSKMTLSLEIAARF